MRVRSARLRISTCVLLSGIVTVGLVSASTVSQAEARSLRLPPGAGQLAPLSEPAPTALPSKDGSVAVTADTATTSTVTAAAAPAAGAEKVALRSLVVALDADDFGIATWSSALDRIGAPYDVMLTKDQPLTMDSLVNAAGVGRYNAILLTNNSMLYQDSSGNFVSAFDADEWNTLWQYERDYAVRQVSLYTAYGTYPEDYCLRPGSEGGVGDTPIDATLTSTGAALFDRLKSAVKIPISLSYVYYSTIEANCGARSILSGNGSTLGVLSTSTDGRERAALTFTSNQYLPQAYLLTYGLIRWANKGVFLGEQRSYLEVDVDDWFNTTDHLLPDGTYSPEEFRMSGTDANATSQMQDTLRKKYPLAKQFTINIAYNGDGIEPSPSKCSMNTADPLTSYSRCLRNKFRWINHTYSHPKMNFTDYATNYYEINQNLTAAKNIQIQVPGSVLKTGEYSGLGVYNPDQTNDLDPPTDYGLAASNTELLAAAKASGVKYLHGNMSFASHRPDCFNCGKIHPLEPSLTIVPDWPTNIAYHVTTPDEETTFYNSYYGPTGKFPYWDHNLNYDEIINYETDVAMQHVMTGSVYTHTMHQGNLREYASGKNLTFDWVNGVVAKYNAYYKTPLLTPDWQSLAGYAADRSSHFATAADVVWDRTLNTLTATSAQGGTAFLTGVRATGYQTYGTESISVVTLAAGTPATLTPVPWAGP